MIVSQMFGMILGILVIFTVMGIVIYIKADQDE